MPKAGKRANDSILFGAAGYKFGLLPGFPKQTSTHNTSVHNDTGKPATLYRPALKAYALYCCDGRRVYDYKAEHAVLRRCDDRYRKIIYEAQVAANTGALTYEQAVDMATKDFLSSGVDCIVYKNGARHGIAEYSRMAIRTANKRANLMGEGNKRDEMGVRTVIVNKRHNACPHCARYVGRVFIDDVYSHGTKSDGDYPLLSEAIKGGLFHPNCRDGTSTYYPELTEIEKIYPHELTEMEQRETLEIKRDAARNQAEKFERMSENSLDAKNRRKYAARAKQWREREAEVNDQLKAMKEKPKPKPEKPKTEKPKPEQPKPSAPKAEKANGIKSVVDSWEAENYKNSTEAGLLITSDGKEIDFGGTDHHVTGKADDIKLMYGAVFTHNHPTDNTFSQNDIVTGLVKGNLKELRAVTSTGDVHILENNGASEEQRKKFSAAYQQRRMKAANAADSKIRKGEKINKDEYVKNRLEAFMSEHADDYNLKYSKAKIKPKALVKSGESGIIKLKDNSSVIHNKDISKYVNKPITETDNQSIREWYVANVNNIPNMIDKSLSREEQAKQAFELRNKFKREARIAMSDKETSEMLERKRPVPTFEELVESKMKRKGMTRKETIEDILKTASSTNADVNKEFGL